ncbi:hypothetical protein EUTSA_v10028069mg, partial [Eutrema salsugineum]
RRRRTETLRSGRATSRHISHELVDGKKKLNTYLDFFVCDGHRLAINQISGQACDPSFPISPYAEVVDPKKCLEESCKPKCVKPLLEYQVCVKRIQDDESGHKHCAGSILITGIVLKNV